MEIGEIYTVNITGKVMRKEIYADKKIRVWIQNDTTQEAAIVIEDKELFMKMQKEEKKC